VVLQAQTASSEALPVRAERSFDKDAHRQCAARRLEKPTPRGALLVRAGQF
jgi:hypothetical protein